MTAAAEPCRCWASRTLPHDGHCCIRDVGEDDTEVRCGHQQEGMRLYWAARGLAEMGSGATHAEPVAAETTTGDETS